MTTTRRPFPGTGTRSYNPGTLALLADERKEGGGVGNPWLAPLRLVRTTKAHLWLWTIVMSLVFGLLAFGIGLVALRSSYSLEASLQLMQSGSTFTAAENVQSYRAPELTAKQVESLCSQQFVYERLQPVSDSDDTIQQFRRRFRIDLGRDTGVLKVTYSGAHTAKKAEEVLDAMFQIVMMASRDSLQALVQKDSEYFERQVTDAERDRAAAWQELDEFRRKHNLVMMEAEITSRQLRVTREEETARLAESRLRNIEYLLRETPKMIERLPTEVPAPTPATSLTVLRDQIRLAEQQYTDKHPVMRAMKEELARREAELAKSGDDREKIPNPYLETLRQKMVDAQQEKPLAERELAEAQQRLAEAKNSLDELPGLSAQYLAIDTRRQQQEELLRRLRARLEEIKAARNLSVNRLRILDPPMADHADGFSGWLKAVVAGIAGACLGFGIGTAIAFLRAVFDRRLRDFADLAEVLGAQRVTRLPRHRRHTAIDRQRWLQDLVNQLTRQNRRFLLLPTGDHLVDETLCAAIARQIGKAGMDTLLLGGPDLPETPPSPELQAARERSNRLPVVRIAEHAAAPGSERHARKPLQPQALADAYANEPAPTRGMITDEVVIIETQENDPAQLTGAELSPATLDDPEPTASELEPADEIQPARPSGKRRIYEKAPTLVMEPDHPQIDVEIPPEAIATPSGAMPAPIMPASVVTAAPSAAPRPSPPTTPPAATPAADPPPPERSTGTAETSPIRPSLIDQIRCDGSLAEACVNLDEHVYAANWGDTNQLFDLLPSGRVEEWLSSEIAEMTEARAVVIVPPENDHALLQRLAGLVDCLVVPVDPKTSDGAELFEIVAAAGKPVAMGILVR